MTSACVARIAVARSLTTDIRCLYVGDTCYENTHGGGSEIKLEGEKSASSKRLFYGPARFHDIRHNFSSQRPLTEPGENAPIRWTGETSSSSSSSFRERVLIINKFRRREQRFDLSSFSDINHSAIWTGNIQYMNGNREISGCADLGKNGTIKRSRTNERDRLCAIVWSDRGARKLALFAFTFWKGTGRRLWMSYRGKALNPRSIILMSRNANNAQHFQGYVLFLNLFPRSRICECQSSSLNDMTV